MTSCAKTRSLHEVGSALVYSCFGAGTTNSKFCWCIPVGHSSLAKTTAHGQFQKAKLLQAKIYFGALKLNLRKSSASSPEAGWIELGSIKQKGGKTVHAWAFEGDLPDSFKLKSNLFEMEWPPRSGKLKEFPEIDRAEFFTEEIARRKINQAQAPFLDRLRVALNR